LLAKDEISRYLDRSAGVANCPGITQEVAPNERKEAKAIHVARANLVFDLLLAAR